MCFFKEESVDLQGKSFLSPQGLNSLFWVVLFRAFSTFRILDLSVFLRGFFLTTRNSFKCFKTLTTLALCVRLFLFSFGRGYKEKTVTIRALLR